jgi:D-sedoheptulose 7-phosphate isomerase
MRSEGMFFPDRLHWSVTSYCDEYFKVLIKAAASIDTDQLQRAADLIEAAVRHQATIFAIGNGGSASIANHLACDCLKGIRTDTAVRPRVMSLAATAEILTAVANDISYDEIFRFQLASLTKPGDVLIAISSSGRSQNIINALAFARENSVSTITMTGFAGGEARLMTDVSLHVDAENYGIAEDVHQSLMHLLAQYIRHKNLLDPSGLGTKKF